MGLNDLLFRRSEPRWMNQEPPPYGYGGNSPRTEVRCIMCCNKCEEKVREEMAEVYGVQDVFTDQARSEVVVYGYADTHDVLKKARKIDKRADILSSDSFTLHHSKHSHSQYKHNNIHHKHSKYDRHSRSQFSDYSHGHSYNGRGTRVAVDQSVGSPRYNSSFNQFRPGGSSSYDGPDYRPSYRPREQEYRHGHDGYRSEPEFRHHHSDMYRPEPEFRHHHSDMYRPQSEFRGMYDDRRPEYEHQYQYSGYRPSQSYPPSYVDERDYREFPYPEMVNPDYMKPVDYYYY